MMTRMISRRVPVSINDFFKDRSIADIREELDKLEAMANYLIGETTRFQIDVTPSETKVFLEIYRTKNLTTANQKIIVVSFPPGGSGNFLVDFLDKRTTKLRSEFRADSKAVENPGRVMLASNYSAQNHIQADFTDRKGITENISRILENPPSFILTHFCDLKFLKDNIPNAQFIKIYPQSNLFGLIKNVFFKKRETEVVSYTFIDNLAEKIDQAFITINDSYHQLIADADTTNSDIIDFGQLYSIDFLTALYKKIYHVLPDQFKIVQAKKYIDAQFDKIEDMPEALDFGDILAHVDPQDYFDLAVCLFIYERNHSTIDKNRLWDITQIPNDLGLAKHFLLENSKNYSIFQ